MAGSPVSIWHNTSGTVHQSARDCQALLAGSPVSIWHNTSGTIHYYMPRPAGERSLRSSNQMNHVNSQRETDHNDTTIIIIFTTNNHSHNIKQRDK